MRNAAVYSSVGAEFEARQPHFLDSCFLCNRSLSRKSDIFMYRGNTPFCSLECRQEQIEIDEALEKRWRTSNSKRSNRQSSESTSRSDDKRSTVVVA